MRTLFLFPSAVLLCFSLLPQKQQPVDIGRRPSADSTKIIHKLDGITTEWPAGLFEIDKETGISYAADNDSSFLFVAMRIPDDRTQIKLMRLGMSFFIDLKGKKKENTGIEFPVKNDHPVSSDNGNTRTQHGNEQQTLDLKTIKKMLALNLLYMRVFGFGDTKSQDQGLLLAGKCNLAFAWDAANVMHIEYRVPLKLLEPVAELQQKTISIGWKINGVDMGPGGGYGENRGMSGANREEMEKAVKENKLWTKYSFKF